MEIEVIGGIALFALSLGMFLGAGIGYFDAVRDQDKRQETLNNRLNEQ